MKKEILSLLICPSCQNEEENLEVVEVIERKDEVFSGFLKCSKGHKFVIKNYIANLCIESDNIMKDSFIYNKLWDLHVKQYYPGRIKEFQNKFNNFAKLPGVFKSYFKNQIILDVGCGEGRFSYLSSEMGANHVVSIDYSLTALNRAIKQTANPKNVSFIRANLLNLPFKKEIFDFIFSFGVLHHTKNTYYSFKNLLSFLKPDGIISIFVYRKNSLPKIQWLLRPISLKIPIEKVSKSCNFFGFSYNRNTKPVIPLANFFKKLGKFDLLGISNITFEGLTTPYLWDHNYNEVKKWFKTSDIEIISSSNSISMSGKKKYKTGQNLN